MTIQVALNHRTSYSYDRLITLGPQLVRLRPAPHCRTRVLSYSLDVQPTEHFINWQQDPFANWQARLVFPERTDHFSVTVDLVAEMSVLNPFDFFVAPSAEAFPFAYDPELKRDLTPFLTPDPAGPKLTALIEAQPKTHESTINSLVELNQRLQDLVGYIIRMEPGVQTPEETLERRQGSCRDTAWLMVQLLRHQGIAARFVSGYLIQLKADQAALDGPSGTDVDFTDLHAWCEAYLPGAGWVGFDPTSGLLAGEGHLPVAATPKPGSAAPISGELDYAEVTFDYAMTITRIHEAPRVTLPYTPTQWSSIMALGDRVDAKLKANDVRLTMGGEPTFVSIDDRDGEEWNTEAVGPTKRGLADDLIQRLRQRFAPDAMIHHGQGKWYPGEQLPRWAFGLYWRDDGQPMWADPKLIAPEEPDANVDEVVAQKFSTALCAALELNDDFTQPVFEDAGHFIAKELALPANVTAENNKLDDPQERQRLAKVFEHGLGRPTGYVLPLQPWQSRAMGDAGMRRMFRWKSEKWESRRGRLFLTPGDSPVGFRLPLSALGYIEPEDRTPFIAADPFAAHAALPARAPIAQPRLPTSTTDAEPGGSFVAGSDAVRTALSVEPRDGKLCIFLPPTQSADEYTDLIHAIEETAQELNQPVQIEGYPPPNDSRLNVVKVTPDPGVIEVNIQPAHSWREQVAITETLYEEARQSRLDTAKFMIDGRPAGTGGGNHVVVGGATPADSPFLRRPDLLGSLVRYWQNHPALSYLFSGLFIGPTSQAPRVDEGRDDQLFELEIALAQIPDPLSGKNCPPWLVDRIMRNLMIDMTGNTHRAEICIDKLYSPDGPTGRLGLVEFRAFEMPPHAQMSLAQQLLIRALIAWFWEKPYTGRLTPFGTGLHDRFMLPHFVVEDFKSVLADLASAGFAMPLEWFAPHIEFRFPTYGTVEAEGCSIELRAALEPWHVMGEEGAVGGTVRYVDSSLERVQIKVTGELGPGRVLACNGWRMPLVQTGKDEAVLGVRFRAWQPPSCLHPTIGVHSPLAFDLVDLKAEHALTGAVYHVMHPAGRSYETMPVNDFEAQGRRLSRFQAGHHSAGRILPAEPLMHPAFPHTLDLRRVG